MWPQAIDDMVSLVRRALDVTCSATGLSLLVPVLTAIAAAILLDDGYPVLYRQRRVGKGMREFDLYKFRSMVNGADRQGLLTSYGDSRLTRCGRFLRRWKLDELPQLFNVLKGDMQLVGCRPEVSCYVEQFRREYEQLLIEPPGITDPASLTFRDEERLLSGGDFELQYVRFVLPQKLKVSLEYQSRRTVWSDLRVLLQTVFRVAAPINAKGSLHEVPAARD